MNSPFEYDGRLENSLQAARGRYSAPYAPPSWASCGLVKVNVAGRWGRRGAVVGAGILISDAGDNRAADFGFFHAEDSAGDRVFDLLDDPEDPQAITRLQAGVGADIDVKCVFANLGHMCRPGFILQNLRDADGGFSDGIARSITERRIFKTVGADIKSSFRN